MKVESCKISSILAVSCLFDFLWLEDFFFPLHSESKIKTLSIVNYLTPYQYKKPGFAYTLLQWHYDVMDVKKCGFLFKTCDKLQIQ